MRLIGLLLCGLLTGGFALAEETENQQKPKASNQPVLMKVVGNLGLKGHPYHPSSNCQINTLSLQLLNHDLDKDDFHVTVAKSKKVSWENLEEIKRKVAEASEEKEEVTKVFAKAHEPPVMYVAIHHKTVKTQVAGRDVEFTRPQLVHLYRLGGNEQQRTGPATEWLIDFMDKNCPNDKPLDELKP